MSENKNVSYSPTDGLCYDPNDELYWQQESLNKELERAFEICHGCRMCFKYCDSFPDLFRFIDENHDGDVRKLTAQETDQVMSSCFQCKLCEVQCPYTPRDSHEYQLDFPKLVHRYQAQKFRKNGSQPSLRDKLLSEPDQAGALARASLGTANLMNRNKAHRWFMEKMVGIHRDKLLPDFAAKSFSSIAKSKGWTKDSSQKVEVVLFQTCFVENNEPNIGEDAIFILEQNQVSYACVD
ncbi:MAG: 4Fe-4S dicluster domain-containing protein, partial [Bdellovibrionales bacterium]|nr:4Fe-4S dicluster domain-containing protein [Bdellovibrionales bacterium]